MSKGMKRSTTRGYGATVRRLVARSVALVYGTTITPDAKAGTTLVISITDGVAFTIAAPLNPSLDQILIFTLRNASGGAAGVATWNAVFKMAAWAQAANANSRSIIFQYNGTNWVERARAGADVPN